MNIYTLLKSYKNNPYSFAAKYRCSVRYNGKLHIDVKNVLESAGLCSTPSKFTSTFNFLENVDIYCKTCTTFKYIKLDAFLALNEYEKNPITFANKFYRKSKDSLYKDYFLKIIKAFEPNFTFDNKNAAKILYDAVYENEKERLCLNCGVEKVKYDRIGYTTYCSSKCASSMEGKMTSEPASLAAKRRVASIKKRRKPDPVWSAEYSRKLSVSTTKRYEDPLERKKQSDNMKKMIANGDFTPNITNSWTRWKSVIGDRKFRSSFDALFFLYSEYNNLDYQYETLRIPYHYEGNKHIYIVDYISHKDKKVVEIKPSGLVDLPKNKAKESSLLEWCSKNKYEYILITEDFLKPFFALYYKVSKNEKHNVFMERMQRVYGWA
jgi:hypothetical protein